MIAEITLVGHLADKPEIKETEGRKYARMRIATDFYKKVDGKMDSYTMWHTIFVHDKFMVEKAEWLQKGDLVYSQGSLRYSEWTDKEGTHHIAPYQSANKIKLLKKGKAHIEMDEQTESISEEESKSKVLFEAPTQDEIDYDNPFMSNPYDEDLPF